MHSVATLRPLFWFILATLLFYLAVQRPVGYFRRILSILHIFSVAICLGGNVLDLVPYARVWVPFVLGFTLHTIAILVLEKRVVELEYASFAQRLRATFRIWTNFRRLPVVDGEIAITSQDRVNCVSFTILRCGRILAIYAIHRLATNFISHLLRPLNIKLEDFAPAKQGLIPIMAYRDLCIRAVLSFQWIWSTYAVLAGAHDILAIFFVSVLRWDLPAQWPALFGSIVEAYSLRRFWGVFWHRLHVMPYEAYMPSLFLYGYEQQYHGRAQQQLARYGIIRKVFRALWMFVFSALCHAIVNWLVAGRSNLGQEIKFFLSNYVLCLAETVARHALGGKLFSDSSVWTRLFGYAWTLAVFFSLVPAWQYSLIYPAKLR